MGVVTAKTTTCTACGKALLGEPLSSGQCVTCAVRAELAKVTLSPDALAEMRAEVDAAGHTPTRRLLDPDPRGAEIPLRDRIITIADEACGMQPLTTDAANDALTLIERELFRLRVEVERTRNLRAVAESFVDVVECAEAAATQKGGQHVPYHDDFAHAPPSTRGQLRRWANAFREASR